MSSLWKIASSAVRLRCPRCLTGPLFAGPFRMNRSCPSCGLVFEREPGYWVGSIYLNYGFTVSCMIAGWFALERLTPLGMSWRLALCAGAGIAVPLAGFRYARALWMALDRSLDPSDVDRPAPRRDGAA